MKWRALFFLTVAVLLHSTRLTGQFYSTGEAPPAIHWNIITTPHFRVIFPKERVMDANKMAIQLEQYFSLGMDDLQHPLKRKFPVLMHSTSVLSNGYVTLAPKRMEVVATPPQDSYAQDWISQLTLHEFRHVAQINLLNQGFTRVLGWATGEIARGAVSSQIPLWLYEGDAVYNETRLSTTGRGRIPGFEMPLRTLLLEYPRGYSYDKIMFGSFRDFVPDHYGVGYQMVCFARSAYGQQVWADALRYTSRHPFLIWPLAFHLKKHYGIYKSGLYHQTMTSLKQQYNNEKANDTSVIYLSIVHRKNRAYTSYLLPKDLDNNRTVALRSGLDDPVSFVAIDSAGNVRPILITGSTNGLKCDVFENSIVWDEVRRDPRWEGRNYSIIRMANLNNGKSHTLTQKSRYFSPDFSPDGTMIAVTENDLQGRNYIVVLNARTGSCAYRIPTPQNRAVQTPEWVSNHEIVAVTVSDAGKQLELVDPETGNWTVIVPFTPLNIAEPVHYRHYILLRSSNHGIENIYAVSTINPAEWYQLTASKYGAYHPAISRDSLSLLFSNYGPHGFDVAKIPLDPGLWKRILFQEEQTPRWNATLNNLHEEPSVEIPDPPFPTEKYNKSTHLFHFHSWLPFYTDVEEIQEDFTETTLSPGLMLYSQNLLSTLTSSIGYNYNQGYHQIIPTLLWRGWYPAFELSSVFGGRQTTLPLPEGVELPDKASPYYELHLKTFVPLIFTKGSNITQFLPSVEYQQTGIWYYAGESLRKGIDFLHMKASINRYQRMALRDLYPRWGQSFNTSYTVTPFEKGQFGNLFSVEASAFFPGLFAHHHFHVRGGFHLQRPDTYFLPINRIDFPRGYQSSVSRELTSLALNYSFPAGYPDVSVGPLLYLKRFRVNLFYDWMVGKDVKEHHASEVVNYTGSRCSLGAEILADMHIIRIIFPVSAGVRMGYLPGERNIFAELLLGMNTGIF